MKTIIMFFAVLISFSALAQNNSIGVRMGLDDFHTRDNYTSPFIFNGVIFHSQLFYNYMAEDDIHSVKANFSKGTLSSKKNDENTVQYIGELSYSFSHVIYSTDLSGHDMKFFIGAGLSTLFLINDNFTEDGITWYGEDDKTWYWSHSLNIETGGMFSIGNLSTVTAHISTPLFRNVSRPEPAHNFSKRNLDAQESFLNAALKGRPEFIWDNLVISCNIEFAQKVKDNVTFNASYGFNYYSSGTPLTMKTYTNNFLIGLGVSF